MKIVHVGLPKTGTSYLQRILWLNRGLLRERGLLQPMSDRSELFAAALHVADRRYEWDATGHDPQRTWERMAGRAREWDGTTVLSSEWLCLAGREGAQRAIADLGDDVHVVVTLRDLARQVPAEWQEGVKHGRLLTFPKYLDCVLGGQGNPSLRERFWQAQDPVGVLDRWAADLPPERVHVITCPPSGAPRDLLWQRFAEVIGVDPDEVRMPAKEINASLGTTQVELLRRVNLQFPRKGQEVEYGAMVKRYYGLDVLGGFRTEKTLLPAAWGPTVEKISTGWVEELQRRGYAVTGDLAELLPAAGTTAEEVPLPDAEELLDLSVRTTEVLLREIHRLRTEAKQQRPVAAPAGPAPRSLPQRARALAGRGRRRVAGALRRRT